MRQTLFLCVCRTRLGIMACVSVFVHGSVYYNGMFVFRHQQSGAVCFRVWYDGLRGVPCVWWYSTEETCVCVCVWTSEWVFVCMHVCLLTLQHSKYILSIRTLKQNTLELLRLLRLLFSITGNGIVNFLSGSQGFIKLHFVRTHSLSHTLNP
jgi:hypothetical protein